MYFTPAEGATVSEPDDDFLHYGYWVDSSTNEDDDPVRKVQTFAGGSIPYTGDLPNPTDRSISATYEGAAVGVYAQKTAFSPQTGALLTGHVGSFTADVVLNANFGQSTSVAVDDQNAISGTISNFMDGEFELGWTATLKTKKFTAGTGETSGGEDAAPGSWTASLFGSSASDFDHDDNAGTDAIARVPSGVAGEFIVHFENGHAAGAYGAEKK